MSEKNKKRFFLVDVIILCFFIFLFLSVIIYNKYNSRDNDGEVETTFSNTSIIEIKSILPLSDEFGKKLDGKGTEKGIQGYTEINIENNKNKKVKYEIYITKSESMEEIRGNYIKFYLTDNIDNPVNGYEQNLIPTYADLYYLSDKPDSKLLYNGVLKAKEKKELKLRVWLSDTYIVTDREPKFVVNIKTRTK